MSFPIYKLVQPLILPNTTKARSVQNRTNQIENCKPIQPKTTENCIRFRCIWVIFLTQLCDSVWFAVFILPIEPNRESAII